MNKIFLERLYMLKTLAKFNEDTSQETLSYPAYQAKAQELKALIAEYDDLSDSVVTSITGYAEQKQLVRLHVIDSVISVSMGLRAMSLDVKNLELFKKVDFPRSTLQRMRDEILLSMAGEMINLGSIHLAQLGPYNITQVTIDRLTSARDTFSDLLVIPRTRINERKDQRRIMYGRITQAMQLARTQLDIIAQLINLQNGNWFARYRDSRMIVNLGPHHTQVKGLIVDAQMQGLYNAKVTVHADGANFETNTDLNGRFVVKGLKPGNYKVEIHKEGYKPFETQYFRVKLGKSFIVNTQLQQEAAGMLKVA